MKKEKLFYILVGIIIALLPVYRRVWVADIERESRDFLLVMLLPVISLLLEKRRELPKIAFLVFGLVLLKFTVSNTIPSLDFVANEKMRIIFIYSINIVLGLVFLASFYRGHNPQYNNYILNSLAIGCLVQSVFVIGSELRLFDYYNFLSIFYGKIDVGYYNFDHGELGTLGQCNILASYLAVGIFSLFRKKWIYALPFVLWSLFLAKSAMGYATFAGGLLYFGWLKLNLNGRLPFILCMLAFAACVYWGFDGQDHGRLEIWYANVKISNLKHWLIGRGPGWFPLNSFVRFSEYFIQEHNEYLAAFNIMGIVGPISMAAVLIYAIPANAQIFSTMIFAIFCNMFGNFFLHISVTAFIAIVVLGVCLVQKRSEDELCLER